MAMEDDGAKQPLSKRQRRALGSHPSTTWQQQPRIQSAGARAKAYIACAGLADDKKQRSKTASGGTKAADLLDPRLDPSSPEIKFGRLLGGTDQRARHAAVKMLREYLRARSEVGNGRGLSELDLLKLWKGLWYTLYMADKVPVQDKLSQLLAELMWCLAGTEEDDTIAGEEYLRLVDEWEDDSDVGVGGAGALAVNVFGDGEFEDEDGDTMRIVEVLSDASDEEEEEGSADEGEEEDVLEAEDDEAMLEDDAQAEDEEAQRIEAMHEPHCRGAHLVSLFVSTFLSTVRREWGNVDKHRLDKFYTAVRFMVGEMYKYMAQRQWNLGIIRLFNDVLYQEGLSSDAPGLTNGLRYHLIDICVDELAKANADAKTPLTEATFLDCLEPFFGLAGNAEDKMVQRRAMERVLEKFLNEYSVVSPVALAEDDGGEGEEEKEKALIFGEVHVGTVAQFLFDMAGDADTDERFRKSLFEMHKTYVRQIRVAGKDVDLEGHMEEDGDDEEEVDGMGDEGQESRHEPDAGETEAPEESEDVTSSVTKYEPETKKKKSKKKRKSKGDDAPETPQSEEKSSNATTLKTKSSKKKKRKKRDADSVEDEADESAAVKTPKSKKKKKQQSPPSVDPRAMHSPDQVVDSPENSDNEEAVAGEASASKRVSFGAMNHCKSHKASMKAVRTLDKDRWDTVTRTPDKSILREKGAASAGTSEKKKKRSGRKKRKMAA
ncbi:hypothetical protein ACHAXT_000717 [Thalassiosira profunda]